MQVDDRDKPESHVDVVQVVDHLINDCKFTGLLKDNKEDGKGTRVYAEGCRLEAFWVSGRRYGKAVCVLDGGKWELEYEDDEIKGEASGSTVDGVFRGHIKEVVLPPGNRDKPRVGTIVNTISSQRGAPDGHPALHFRAGQRLEIVDVMRSQNAWYATETAYTTLWFPLSSTDWHVSTRKQGKGKKLKEELFDASLCSLAYQPCGQGSISNKDGSAYEGEWKDGERHGAGHFRWAPSQHANSPCYEGAWKEGKMEGRGVMTWGDGSKFSGTFCRNCPVAGVLEKPSGGVVVSSILRFNVKSNFECPSGHEMMQLSSRPEWTCDRCNQPKRVNPRMRCARCDYDICEKCRKETAQCLHDMFQTPQLPAPFVARDIGRISANLWSAIENGAVESYGNHARALELSVADRILIKSLHVEENPSTVSPGSRREALSIKFQHGDKATEQIIKAFSGADVAKRMQWAIEIEAAPRPQRPQALMLTKGDIPGLKIAQLQRHLKARGVKAQGKKIELQAMLAAALAAEAECLGEEEDANMCMLDGDELLEPDADDITKMVHAGARGLADFEVAGCTPFRLTPAESLQPDPLCVHKMEQLRSTFAAVGRLIGCALWNGKTLGVAPARFFCRRLLEMVRVERLKVFDMHGPGPEFFGLVGSLVRIKVSSALEDEGCPKPLLRPPPGGSYTYEVLDAMSKGGQVFIRCQAHREDPRHAAPGVLGLDVAGWVHVKASDAKLVSREQCDTLWGSMQRLHLTRPYNGTFVVPKGARAICGQPVRVRKLLPPPVFFPAKAHEKNVEAEARGAGKSVEQPAGHLRQEAAIGAPRTARRIKGAQDEALAKALSAGLSEEARGAGKSVEQPAGHLRQEAAIGAPRISRRGEGAQDEALAKALSAGLPEQEAAAATRLEGDEQSIDASVDASPSKSHVSPLGCSHLLDTPLLLGSNPHQYAARANFGGGVRGVCFLPSWAIRALGVSDGEEVEVEALPLPLNRAGRAMRASPKGLSWHCGCKIDKIRCEAHRKSCPDCRAVSRPDLSGGLSPACRIEWRLAQHHLVGEVEVHLGQSIGTLLCQKHLSVIKVGMVLPVPWGFDTVHVCAQVVRDDAGRLLQEAVLSDRTAHLLLPPPLSPEASLSPMRGKQPSAKGKEAVGGGEEEEAQVKISSHPTAEELLNGEMMADYLEQAARDDVDRAHIKRNEFGWLLKNNISDLNDDGMLPPRFTGLAGGAMLRQVESHAPNKRRFFFLFFPTGLARHAPWLVLVFIYKPPNKRRFFPFFFLDRSRALRLRTSGGRPVVIYSQKFSI